MSAAGDSDKVTVRFESEDWFYDEYGQPLRAGTEVEASIPRQFRSAEEKQRVEQTASLMSAASGTIVIINMIMNIFMAASLQYLWEMINA